MTTQGNWDDVINNAEVEYFVGREHEQDIFRRQLKATPPRYVVFYITGQAGAGKTTLLTRYQKIASEMGFLLADCDEQQRDVPAVLGRFAHQFAEQGFPLKHFDERYKVYYQKMHEIENDPEAPQGLAALIGRTVVRAVFIGGDLLPGIRKGLENLPRESIETQASEWAAYLGKKLGSKDEVALIREPAPILTPLFFEDLNEIAEKWQVLLCFDNFQATRQELEEWLLRLREYKPSFNTRIVIAGQDLPGARWDVLRKVTLTIRLDIFTEREAQAFLDAYGIINANRRSEILEFSGRLPVLMSWLSAPEGQDADPTVPTHDIVERFLRWVPEPSLRQVALLAAISRIFNLDILRLLLKNSNQRIDVQSAFDWLLTMPFVQQRSDGWQYHSVVRRMMLFYQRQKSPQDYQQLHIILADFYNARRREVSISAGKKWTNEEWRACTLAYVYHFLIADPVQHWSEVVSLFAVALRKRRSFAVEMIELLNSDDVHDELSHDQNDTVRLFKQQLRNIEDGDLENGFEMFDKLANIADLNSQAKGIAFAYRGVCHREYQRLEKALSDLDYALQCMPQDTWIIAQRGITHRNMKQYQEALIDFDSAVTLDKQDDWIIINQGETYRKMGCNLEALASFNAAIALNAQDSHALLHRGQTYQAMERYEEALADFDRAIALDDKAAWVLASRGKTYRVMRRYKEALADFDCAIALDDKAAWALASRGETYRVMRHYEEALADFDRAIALDDKAAWVLAHRGETYGAMKRYKEAFADFEQAIALDEKTCAFAHRGETYRVMRRYKEALADFDHAITLDSKAAWVIASRGQTYQAMRQYEEALTDLDCAIALDGKLDWAFASRGEVYRVMRRYKEALADFDHAIALDSKAAWVIASRGETYRKTERYEEALADFDHAIALGYDSYNERGLVLSYLERYAAAIDSYEQRLKMQPDNYMLLYNIAVSMVRGGFPHAQKYLDEARTALQNRVTTSESGAGLYGLGGLEAVVGNIDAALDYLQQALLLHMEEAVDWARQDMAWEDLRIHNDPRFRSLVPASN